MRNIEMASRNDLKRRGDNITKSPLNKNATLYLAALKSMVVPMGWAEIKRSVEIAHKAPFESPTLPRNTEYASRCSPNKTKWRGLCSYGSNA